MQNKKRMKTMIAATAMIGVLAIGGISAYFTDGDTATNTFTVGKVSIDLQEPNWNPPKDITPNQEIKKDPQIKNDGINDACPVCGHTLYSNHYLQYGIPCIRYTCPRCRYYMEKSVQRKERKK